MKAESINAWYLRSRPSGDTSLRITFFSREHGIIEALYKGGRTPKKKSILQPFMPLWLALNVRHDWHYIQKIETDSFSFPLLGQSLFAGLYVNEMLYSMLKPNDAVPILYETYVDTLQGLAKATGRASIEFILRRFEYALLDCSGYGISFTHDAQTRQPIDEKACYRFIGGTGFCLSEEGFSGRDILAFSAGELERPETLQTIKRVMRLAIAHALDGKEIQTRKLYCSR